MGLLNISRFHDGHDDCLIDTSDKDIQSRRFLMLSHLSKAIFDSNSIGIGRGDGAFIPDRHQWLALECFITPWLNDIFTHENNHKNTNIFTKRDTLILADEGGMGKTYSAVIVALEYLKKSGSVVVLCPPLLKKDWYNAFKIYPHRVRTESAAILKNGNLREGITIISKYSLQRHSLTERDINLLGEKINLCILDEAHEGMITKGKNKPLRESIKSILDISKKNLILTATPIRSSWQDFKNLLISIIKIKKI